MWFSMDRPPGSTRRTRLSADVFPGYYPEHALTLLFKVKLGAPHRAAMLLWELKELRAPHRAAMLLWELKELRAPHRAIKQVTGRINVENIALRKPTWQSTTHDPSYSGSSRAVDGQRTDLSYHGRQCSVSSNTQTTATWWVNLERKRGIIFIVIYYRTENGNWSSTNGFTTRFLGFQVYISNTTDRLKGHLCFHDTNYTISTIPAVVNITCPVHGQYVIYHNERRPGVTYPDDYSKYAYIELCEVEVYGCPDPTHYGSDCSYKCSTNCLQYCDIVSGKCPSCAPGYKGKWCEQACLKGSFGKNCSETCSSACYDSTCNRTNGRCDNGCYPGWKGDYCNEACSEGYFGEKCVHKCNDTCKGCNNVNGVCEHGCHTGWKGDFCDEECDYNQYGTACNKTCGNCINSETCHHINGFCVNGCDSGYQGNKCDQVCEFGFYGINCRDVCSTFCKVSRDCHHVTGVCKFGCKAGMTGLDCLRGLKNRKKEITKLIIIRKMT
ncbi:uncharacterized protein LOC134246680 [Saccostrea cucullata]|uniref:uncharacterized protein LOC134246680 n=1 Tax=Saccostrea cuccullata TaxID=36930 RepID=UPI002ED54006